MKLKKIASLALAGIMAVSMLAGCSNGNENNDGQNNGGDLTPSANYTDVVLGEVNASTKAVMSASTNDKLDRAVSTVAENFSMNTDWIDSTVGLKGMSESGNTYATILSAVKKIMNGAKYDELNIATAQWNFDPTSLKDDGTWYTMAYVSRAMSDEYITELVADQLNAWAENMVDDEKIVNNANWDYTVSVAKADCLGGDDSVRSDDAVIIGVAITVTKTDVKY